MTISNNQLEAIQEQYDDVVRKEDLKRVEAELFADTPIEIYQSRRVYVFDDEELIYRASKVMNDSALSTAVSHARMYAFGAGYRDKY